MMPREHWRFHKCRRLSPSAWARPQLLHASNRQQRHGQVVDDGRYGLPNRERPDSFGVERYHDRVSGMDFGRLRPPEPAGTFSGNDVAVRSHHVDALPIGLLRGAPAPGDVVVTREARHKHMGSGTLHLAQDRYFLILLWNQ